MDLSSKHTLLVCVLVGAILNFGYCQEKLPIYKDVSSYPCTVLSDLNGSIGCRSSRPGDAAPLWPIETQQDLDDFVNSPPSNSKVIVMESLVFTRTNVDKLYSTKKVKGIAVAAGPKPSVGWSPVSRFPQKQYGLHSDSNFDWNPLGDDFAFQYYEMPIFALEGNPERAEGMYSSEDVLRSARENKAKDGKYPQWGLSFHAFMHSSGNAEVCLRRGQCQPLGGRSVWSSFGPVDPNKEIIFATSTLDSNAFFHELAIGADADMSGVIALLGALHGLSKVDRSAFTKQVLFGFFAGESWGYLGSKKFVADITEFKCEEAGKDGKCTKPYKYSLAFQNIKLDKISAILDLSQVGNLAENSGDASKLNLYVHQEKSQSQDPNQNLIYKTLTETQSRTNLTVTFADPSTPGIPPSPLMSFLKVKPSLLSVVLAEHHREFTNKYYHSRFDDASNVQVDSVCRVSSLLANTLYSMAVPTPGNVTVDIDCALISSLLQCFTDNLNCPLGKDYLEGAQGFIQPSQYTSVYYERAILSLSTAFVYSVAFDWTATSRDSTCESASDCTGNQLCLRGNCVTSDTYYHDAVSLAFERSGSAWKIVNPSESTWTESNWDATYLQMFLMDSPATEVVMFIFGILNILVSFGVTWYLRSYLTKRLKST